jgi:hypothetical protein
LRWRRLRAWPVSARMAETQGMRGACSRTCHLVDGAQRVHRGLLAREELLPHASVRAERAPGASTGLHSGSNCARGGKSRSFLLNAIPAGRGSPVGGHPRMSVGHYPRCARLVAAKQLAHHGRAGLARRPDDHASSAPGLHKSLYFRRAFPAGLRTVAGSASKPLPPTRTSLQRSSKSEEYAGERRRKQRAADRVERCAGTCVCVCMSMGCAASA